MGRRAADQVDVEAATVVLGIEWFGKRSSAAIDRRTPCTGGRRNVSPLRLRIDEENVVVAGNGARVSVDIEFARAHAEPAKSVVAGILLPVQGDGAVLQEQRVYGGEALLVEIRRVDAANFRPWCSAPGAHVVPVKSPCASCCRPPPQSDGWFGVPILHRKSGTRRQFPADAASGFRRPLGVSAAAAARGFGKPWTASRVEGVLRDG